MITKKEVKEALTKYGIEFGFPVGARMGGYCVTVWTDVYHLTKGNIDRLMQLIDDDKDCPFYTCRDIMIGTFRLKRK